MWQIETYNQNTRRWEPYKTPSADFAALYAECAKLAEKGHKARVVKIAARGE